MDFFLSGEFWHAVIRSTTPVLFATLAAAIVSKCGLVNLAIEGTMLISALVGVFASAFTESLIIGAILGIFAGILVSWILGFFAIKMKSNIIVTGVALNLLATGGTVFALYTVTGDKTISSSLQSKVFPSMDLPFIKDIPFIGDVLSGHNVLTYVALIMVVVIFILLYKTSLGIKIRAVGESEEAAKSVGIKINTIKIISLTICGTLASLGGMFLSMGYLSMFTANMTAGRGYIALATDAMANSHPIGAFFSSFVYGISDSIAVYLQNTRIPLEFIQMFPYVFVALVFSIFSYRRKIKNKETGSF